MRTKPHHLPAQKSERNPRQGRLMTWVAVGLSVLALLFLGRGWAGSCSRYMAERAMNRFTFSQAFIWLQRAEWIHPHDGRTALLRARCYRQLNQWDRHDEFLTLARTLGAPAHDVRNEAELSKIQLGDFTDGAEGKLREFHEAGMSPHDVNSAFILGYIVRQDTQGARTLLAAWNADYPGHPQVLYMRGMLLNSAGDQEGARKVFQEALAAEPGHEPALLLLAQCAEATGHCDEALDRYAQLAELQPDNAFVLVGLSRTLRQFCRHKQAREVLERVPESAQSQSGVQIEWGQLEMETGDYASAKRHFDRVSAQDMANNITVTAAAIALGMLGDTQPADRALLRVAEECAQKALIDDLETRLTVDPDNQDSRVDLQNLTQSLSSLGKEGNPYEIAFVDNRATRDELPGMKLYQERCGACHGPNGNGRGRAARLLFPMPRNLRAEPMRIVSTDNGIPARDDVKRAIRNGLPGTAMVALKELTDVELDQLADVVLKMRHDGIREQYIAFQEKNGEPFDDQEVSDVVRMRTTPGRTVVAPPIELADASSITAGKELYLKHACQSCHGEVGTGDDLTPLFDSLGQPSFPRDLRRDLFKGGNEAEAIYLRIRVGMPGSPHPANTLLTEQQLIDVVRYCASLGGMPKSKLSNFERSIQASTRRAIEFRDTP